MSATPPSPTSAKICGLCGQDCSNKPRIKDNAGNYFCKACMEAKQAAKPAPAAAPRPTAPRALAPASASGGGYDIFADNVIGSKKISGPSKLCASCNSPMKEDAVVCVNCGYNQQSGKGLKTKIAVDKEPKARKSRGYMSAWTLFFIFSGVFALISCVGFLDPSMFMGVMGLIMVCGAVAKLSLVVSAFQEGETMWGVLCLVLPFADIFYAFFVSDRRFPKAMYGAVVVGGFCAGFVAGMNPDALSALGK